MSSTFARALLHRDFHLGLQILGEELPARLFEPALQSLVHRVANDVERLPGIKERGKKGSQWRQGEPRSLGMSNIVRARLGRAQLDVNASPELLANDIDG